jgi:hypothetical protein
VKQNCVVTSIGGPDLHGIVRLDATTGLADSFDPNVGGVDVLLIAVHVASEIIEKFFGPFSHRSPL